ncbi:MAG: transposase [Gemmatimonadetes bacterium]|nr:transposase [Gemmatimonadota bacterium]
MAIYITLRRIFGIRKARGGWEPHRGDPAPENCASLPGDHPQWKVHYCRLGPGSNDSGGKTRHKRSRDGNRYLKLALHHAAIRAVQYFPEVRAVYQAWVRRKGKAIARALVAKETRPDRLRRVDQGSTLQWTLCHWLGSPTGCRP